MCMHEYVCVRAHECVCESVCMSVCPNLRTGVQGVQLALSANSL